MRQQQPRGNRKTVVITLPRPLLSAAIGLVAAVSVLAALALMWASAGGGQTIPEDQAVQAAISQVQADGIMSLEGRDTIAVIENGNWHVSFPLSLIPEVLWGDIDCSTSADPGDSLEILRQLLDLSEGEGGCPDVGTVIDPSTICADQICSNAPRGGEPHVIVNGNDGSIEDVYYTQ